VTTQVHSRAYSSGVRGVFAAFVIAVTMTSVAKAGLCPVDLYREYDPGHPPTILTDPPVHVTSHRTLTTYLFSLDVGFLYYMIKPEVQKIAPYIGGGFSGVVPYEKLESSFITDEGEEVAGSDDSATETSFEPGVYAQFGINYYISNKWGVALDGRFQMAQSTFKIYGGNFDINYAGLCLALGLQYYF
jgi:hypothetical protein